MTRDELNVRTEDPVSRRLVDAAQRASFRKYCTVALGASKVADLQALLVDQKAVTYSVIADGSIPSTTAKPPSHGAARDIAIDDVGNVYILDGALGWAKYSADLTFVQAVAAPIINRAAVLRALEVDEFRNVYAAVESWRNAFCLLRFRRERRRWLRRSDNPVSFPLPMGTGLSRVRCR